MENTEIVKVNEENNDILQEFYQYGDLVLVGPTQERLDEIVQLLKSIGGLNKNAKIYNFDGRLVNQSFRLINEYRDDLQFYTVRKKDFENLQSNNMRRILSGRWAWLDIYLSNNIRKDHKED